jgi:NifU-like protein involved in Fe-S cluster formation
MNELYQRQLLELAANIPHLGELAERDARATAHSRLCGSTLAVDIKLDGETVTGFAQQVKACALGQAAAGAVGAKVIGSTAQELRDLRQTMHNMLKENGLAPTGKWASLSALETVRDYPARHASTLLVFDAIVQALDDINSKRAAA